MNSQTATSASLGQSLFVLGLFTLPIGIVIWIFVGCDRPIRPFCGEHIFPIYWIGAVIAGAGALMFIIGWLLMKEERANESTPLPDI